MPHVVTTAIEHPAVLECLESFAAQGLLSYTAVPVDGEGLVSPADVEAAFTDSSVLLTVMHSNNEVGSIQPIAELAAIARRRGALVHCDAAQSIGKVPVDVQQLDVDFLAASSHKMCGPTGIGFLYGKYALLEAMPPLLGGGEMIDQVFLEHSTYALPPSRFEAGTPPIAEAVGLGAAVEYLQSIGMERVLRHEQRLGEYLYAQLQQVEGLELYGPRPDQALRTGLVAFNSKEAHPTDLAFFLDQEGVAVRSGHHCTQPLHRHFNVPGSLRASLYFYNNKQDVDVFIAKLRESMQLLKMTA
jgi:cysteine desulfurase/selenocysteine lyase